MPSIRDRCLRLVESCPGQTATQIAKTLEAKLSSVASELLKAVDSGILYKVTGMGPRGGYGYFWIYVPQEVTRKTAWEHILTDDSV